MAEKKGAGGKNQAFDSETGRYGSGGSKRNAEKVGEAADKYSDDLSDIARMGIAKKIGIQEYAVLKKEIFRKQSQRGYNKKHDYAYTADNFYIFDNHDIGSFTITAQIPIVGNEERIDYYWRMLDNE